MKWGATRPASVSVAHAAMRGRRQCGIERVRSVDRGDRPCEPLGHAFRECELARVDEIAEIAIRVAHPHRRRLVGQREPGRHVLEVPRPQRLGIGRQRERTARSPYELALVHHAGLDVRETDRANRLLERTTGHQEAVKARRQRGQLRRRPVGRHDERRCRRRQDQHPVVGNPARDECRERARIGHVLDHLGCVNDVEALPRERRAVLQELAVNRDAQLLGADATVVRELDADRLAPAGPLPEVEREAEAAADVEQPAAVARGENRPDGLPDAAARLDVEPPEVLALLVEVGEVADVRRIVEQAFARRAAQQGQHQARVRQAADTEHRSSRIPRPANRADSSREQGLVRASELDVIGRDGGHVGAVQVEASGSARSKRCGTGARFGL